VHRVEWTADGAGRVARTVERWPAHVEAFLRTREAGDAPAVADGTIPPPPEIAYPKDGTVFRLTGVAGEHLALRARDDGAPRHWFINGRPLRWTAAGEALPWPMERGAHTILCADASGRAARARITVE
jgi:membrane carboxypeptidase/penicillin-binding protein PbpC